MNYLTFVVLIVPAVIGLLAALTFGPNRGVLLGALGMLIAVYVLLLFQITVPQSGPGAEASRFSSAWGLMLFEWIRWAPSYLVGAAVGSLVHRSRSGRAPQV